MKTANKKQFLEELRNIPVISVACQKIGISRMTYYRWVKQFKQFKKDVEAAMETGNQNICDIAETTLINCLKDEDKNLQAAKFILSSVSKKYRNKLEVNQKVEETTLTASQKEQVRKIIQKINNK